MERRDELGAIRAAYERGRVARAARMAALAVPMVIASFGGCGRPAASIAIGVALFALAFTLHWHGGVGGRAVRAGLVAGAVSLAFPLVACRALERAGIGGVFPFASCVVGGLVGGLVACRFAARAGDDRGRFLAAAGAIAILAGALGCLGAGLGGVIAMSAGLAITAPLGLRPIARPS